jgi:hypothetical protein
MHLSNILVGKAGRWVMTQHNRDSLWRVLTFLALGLVEAKDLLAKFNIIFQKYYLIVTRILAEKQNVVGIVYWRGLKMAQDNFVSKSVTFHLSTITMLYLVNQYTESSIQLWLLQRTSAYQSGTSIS